jgi:anti-anti-sigma factor
VDISSAPWLDEELRRAQQTGVDVVVDLERVEFMGCAGLSVLLKAVHRANSGQSPVSVTPGSPHVQKLFALSGIDRLVRLVPRPPTRHDAPRRWAATGSVALVSGASAS